METDEVAKPEYRGGAWHPAAQTQETGGEGRDLGTGELEGRGERTKTLMAF